MSALLLPGEVIRLLTNWFNSTTDSRLLPSTHPHSIDIALFLPDYAIYGQIITIIISIIYYCVLLYWYIFILNNSNKYYNFSRLSRNLLKCRNVVFWLILQHMATWWTSREKNRHPQQRPLNVLWVFLLVHKWLYNIPHKYLLST